MLDLAEVVDLGQGAVEVRACLLLLCFGELLVVCLVELDDLDIVEVLEDRGVDSGMDSYGLKMLFDVGVNRFGGDLGFDEAGESFVFHKAGKGNPHRPFVPCCLKKVVMILELFVDGSNTP